MWIVYDYDTLKVLKKFYTKAPAKAHIAAHKKHYKLTYGLDKVEVCKLEQWKTFKLLQRVA
jgi:hypothetical protein